MAARRQSGAPPSRESRPPRQPYRPTSCSCERVFQGAIRVQRYIVSNSREILPEVMVAWLSADTGAGECIRQVSPAKSGAWLQGRSKRPGSATTAPPEAAHTLGLPSFQIRAGFSGSLCCLPGKAGRLSSGAAPETPDQQPARDRAALRARHALFQRESTDGHSLASNANIRSSTHSPRQNRLWR